MPLGTSQMTITTGANFIPEVWVSEIRAYLRASLVLASKVKMFPFEGQKGDILHVPDVSELSVNAKAANTQVTLQSPTESQFTLTINQHWESSFVREDILSIQASYDLRNEYTKSAGYAIAKKIDSDLFTLQSTLTNRVIGSDGVTAFSGVNAADMTEAGIRRVIETLDTANVADDGNRCMVIHPAQKNVLLGISRFTEYQMLGAGGMPIRTGMFGEIFGMPVYVTTQVPVIATASHANLILHKDAFAVAVQAGPRVQSAYILEYLGWLTVIDVLYGFAEFRDNYAVAVFTPQ